MLNISTNDNILQIKGRETKFDTAVVSNSLVDLLDSYLEARIVQQLHYWTVKEYGRVINDIRWIYKSIREWRREAIAGFTSWQLRKAIAALVDKGILLRKHLFKEHHGHNFAPKNRTYYYSLNYEGLEEFVERRARGGELGSPPVSSKSQIAETVETVRFVSSTNQFCDSSEKQFGDSTKNKTKNTSIENSSKDKSHPTKESEGGKNSTSQNQEENSAKCSTNTFELENNLGQVFLKEESISPDVDEKVNIKNINTIEREASTPKPKPQKTSKGTKPNGHIKLRRRTAQSCPQKHKKEAFALWNSPQQRERFRKDLTAAIASGVGRAKNITALVAYVMNEVRQGHSHTYWEEWINGKVLGSSEKQEWEANPGKPFPKFVEYLLEKLIYPTESRQQALFRVGKILADREQAELYWRDFKRNIESLRQQSEQMQRDGQTPTVPTWFIDRTDVSLSRASESAQKVAQLTPNQKDWLEKKLPESEKLISGRGLQAEGSSIEETSTVYEPRPEYDSGGRDWRGVLANLSRPCDSPSVNCPPLPPAEYVRVEDENEDFCFNGFITLDYLENQARRIAVNSGKLGILLPDFRAAISQANSAQRERIRSAASICPELLNLI
jgi:hypothetical protein